MKNFNLMVGIWNDFCERFPTIADRAIDYYRSGVYEITILLPNSERAIYESLGKTIRFISSKREVVSEEDWRNSFATIVSRKMMSRGLSQKDLAERLGISSASVSKYVNGKAAPSISVLRNMADIFGCSVTELIELDI